MVSYWLFAKVSDKAVHFLSSVWHYAIISCVSQLSPVAFLSHIEQFRKGTCWFWCSYKAFQNINASAVFCFYFCQKNNNTIHVHVETLLNSLNIGYDDNDDTCAEDDNGGSFDS